MILINPGIIKLVFIIPFLFLSFMVYLFLNIYCNIFLFKLVKYLFSVLYLLLGLWGFDINGNYFFWVLLFFLFIYIFVQESRLKKQKFFTDDKERLGKKFSFYIELFNENFIFAGQIEMSLIKLFFSFGLKFIKSAENISGYKEKVSYILDNISGGFCEIENNEVLIKFYV